MRITLAKLDDAREMPSGGFEYRIPLNMYSCAIAVEDFERDVHWEEGRHVAIPYMYSEKHLGYYIERDESGDINMYGNDGNRVYTVYNGEMFDYYRRIERLSPRITSLEFKDVCYVGSTFSHRHYMDSSYYDDTSVRSKLDIQPFMHEVVVRTPVRNAWLDNEIYKVFAIGTVGGTVYMAMDRMVRETDELLTSRMI